MSTKTEFFTVGPATLAFPALFVPSKPRGTAAEEKYNTNVLITKEQYDTLVAPQIQALIGAAGIGNDTQNPKFNWPFYPCTAKPDTYPEAAARGMYYGNLKSQFPIEVVDGARQKIIDPGVVRDGAIAHVSMNLYSYSKGGGIGIAAGLGPVLYVEQGEVLDVSGGVSVDDAFATVAVSAAAPAPMAQPVAAPVSAPVVAPQVAPTAVPAAPVAAPVAPQVEGGVNMGMAPAPPVGMA